MRFEPLPVDIDQGNYRDRGVEQPGCQLGNVVESGILDRVKDTVSVKCGESSCLDFRQCHHSPLLYAIVPEVTDVRVLWSGCRDLNSGPLAPQARNWLL